MILRHLYDSVRDPYTPRPMSPQVHRDYCADQARTYDYDRYFAATFAPADVRRGLLALYAFNIEIASARERVSEALLGEIRLQWWRNAIGEIYDGSVREHAVASEIAVAIERFALPKESFDRMIDGRVFDMDEEAPEDINAFDNYISTTAGEMTVLCYRMCGAIGQDDEARLLGSVWGGAGLLRAIPFHLSQGRVYLPKDLMLEAGLSASILAANTVGAELVRAVIPLADWLRDKLGDVQKIEKSARPAAAYVVLADIYLNRLRGRGHDVFAPRLEIARSARQFRILRSIMTGRI